MKGCPEICDLNVVKSENKYKRVTKYIKMRTVQIPRPIFPDGYGSQNFQQVEKYITLVLMCILLVMVYRPCQTAHVYTHNSLLYENLA